MGRCAVREGLQAIGQILGDGVSLRTQRQINLAYNSVPLRS